MRQAKPLFSCLGQRGLSLTGVVVSSHHDRLLGVGLAHIVLAYACMAHTSLFFFLVVQKHEHGGLLALVIVLGKCVRFWDFVNVSLYDFMTQT